jgi:hypothetical protein
MTLAINSSNPVQTNTDTAVAIKTAQKAQSQQEIEGEMAINLIETAALPQTPSPVGNSGHNVNIKV